MKQDYLYDEFEKLADKLNITILQGKGDFEGGFCTLKGVQFVVLNKSRPLEQRLRVLAISFGDLDLEEQYILPVLRKFININSKN
ncbi:MAG: hypothetical protein CMG75_00350 [Candidatus Marinimicrobia bacterium]|nr:hypothetical protein [Candidatus Neomarinimicrobiota bacterium]|tara:strand:- start:2860 stop:3114 length:255 start_codon:yes stop_codon:yes gene_type:complete